MGLLGNVWPRQPVLVAALFVLCLIWSVTIFQYNQLPHNTTSIIQEPSEVMQTADSATLQTLDPAPDNSRPLILYAYAHTDNAFKNLRFFLSQGLHGGADFIFILNGVDDEIMESMKIPRTMDNIRVIQRSNTCFDLGAYGETLKKYDLVNKYTRFIMLNASLRGPFLPHWASNECWSDLYLSKLSAKTKLVGMTANCWPQFHVQSMIWATDRVGISLLFDPPRRPISEELHIVPPDADVRTVDEHSAKTSNNSDITNATSEVDAVADKAMPTSKLSIDDPFGDSDAPVGLSGCYDGWSSAVHAEIGSTRVILEAGYDVDLMMAAYHKSGNYREECDSSENGDVLKDGGYYGSNVHPFETIFMKTNRDISPTLIQSLTEWQLGSGRSSWKACGGFEPY